MQAKRNKAFGAPIVTAIDGAGTGWRTQRAARSVVPRRNLQKQKILGYQHFFVLISVVGAGLSSRSST